MELREEQRIKFAEIVAKSNGFVVGSPTLGGARAAARRREAEEAKLRANLHI